jgi:hypothetical protein
MLEHWGAGQADMIRSLQDPRWLGRVHADTGVRVFDLNRGPAEGGGAQP